jgi:hypothetical protein
MVVGVDEHQSGQVLARRQQVLLCLAESPVGAFRAGDVGLMLAAGRRRAACILVQGSLQRTGLQFQVLQLLIHGECLAGASSVM